MTKKAGEKVIKALANIEKIRYNKLRTENVRKIYKKEV